MHSQDKMEILSKIYSQNMLKARDIMLSMPMPFSAAECNLRMLYPELHPSSPLSLMNPASISQLLIQSSSPSNWLSQHRDLMNAAGAHPLNPAAGLNHPLTAALHHSQLSLLNSQHRQQQQLQLQNVEKSKEKISFSIDNIISGNFDKSRRSNGQFTELPSSPESCTAQSDNGGLKYECEVCAKTYSTFSGFTKHKQFYCTPQNRKQINCKHCDKTYNSLGALKMHIRTHTLPCKCKVCGKAFSRPWLLQGHMRTHTGEKPFKCQHCGRAFADRSNLRAHLQTHSDIKKYSCKQCDKTFSRMSLLIKHEESACTTSPPQSVVPPIFP